LNSENSGVKQLTIKEKMQARPAHPVIELKTLSTLREASSTTASAPHSTLMPVSARRTLRSAAALLSGVTAYFTLSARACFSASSTFLLKEIPFISKLAIFFVFIFVDIKILSSLYSNFISEIYK
jgi:hypothetical protein